MPTVPDIHRRGTRAAQGAIAAGTLTVGTLYFVTDEDVIERWTGSAWESYSGAGGGGVPAAHAASHASAGSDPVPVTTLAGFPGGTATFLRADGTFAAAVGAAVRRQVTVVIDGGGAVITTGVKAYLSLPLAGTWKKWRLLSTDAAATAGSIVIDVWKAAYASYPPTVAGTITAGAKPTLSAAAKNEDATLAGWTTAFAAGDVLGVSVDSAATVTRVSLTLEFE